MDLARRLLRLLPQLLKYGAASAAALAVDYGVMVALTELVGLHYLASAFIGFSCGVAVVYVLSVTLVFQERRVRSRGAEFGLFALVGVGSLGLNEVLMFALVDGLGLHYALAKIPVAGIVFLTNFTVRRWLLFSGPAAQPAAA